MRLNTLAVRVSMFWNQEQLIHHQQKLIRLLKEQRNRQQLDHARELQGLVSAWLICLETPEVDLREELAALECACADRVSILEEHLV